MRQFTYRVTERQGFHARNAMAFARQAGEYQSDIRIQHRAGTADGKNVLDIMRLAIKEDDGVTFTVEGEDEEQAASYLEALVREIL